MQMQISNSPNQIYRIYFFSFISTAALIQFPQKSNHQKTNRTSANYQTTRNKSRNKGHRENDLPVN